LTLENTIIKIKDVSKRFGGTIALDKVSFSIDKGEVHALVGENGAGKSTLMKILAGVQIKDSGSIYIGGKKADINNPLDSKYAGISMVFQELNNFPHLTVSENIFMTNEINSGGGILNNRQMIKKSRELLKNLAKEHDINPVEVLGRLSVADQQVVEIVKAQSFGSNIIILDEPNSALSESESLALFNLIRSLKNKGITIIYVSHRLEEVFSIADRITVLRDGKYINTWNIAETTIKETINAMVGKKLKDVFPPERILDKDSEVVLEVRGLGSRKGLKSVSFKLHKGEVLGFAGLEDCGIEDIFRILFGLEKKTSGEIIFEGKMIEKLTPWNMIKKKWALVPAERHRQGLMTNWSIKDNISFVMLKELRNRLGLINGRALRRLTLDYVKRFNIITETDDIYKTVLDLSGGNQQKVAIAKWLATEPGLIILNDPTRGIDVGAKAEIYKLIDNLARQHHAILFTSSEFEEILELSDNIITVYDGKIVGSFKGRKTDKKELMSYITGSFECKESTYSESDEK
jgi:ABC-type sugar transport system ATPase subunit